jgi:hypothetical protein
VRNGLLTPLLLLLWALPPTHQAAPQSAEEVRRSRLMLMAPADGQQRVPAVQLLHHAHHHGYQQASARLETHSLWLRLLYPHHHHHHQSRQQE